MLRYWTFYSKYLTFYPKYWSFKSHPYFLNSFLVEAFLFGRLCFSYLHITMKNRCTWRGWGKGVWYWTPGKFKKLENQNKIHQFFPKRINHHLNCVAFLVFVWLRHKDIKIQIYLTMTLLYYDYVQQLKQELW